MPTLSYWLCLIRLISFEWLVGALGANMQDMCAVPLSHHIRTCAWLPAKQATHDTAPSCCHPLDAAAAAACWLDVALQQVEKRYCVGEPVGQAGIVVLLSLYLAANHLQQHHKGVDASACLQPVSAASYLNMIHCLLML